MFSCILMCQTLFGQNKPFPQNSDYPYGFKTSVIPEADITNAYNRWKDLFLLPAGDGMYRVCGDDTSITISEGMGYGMLLTAYHGEKDLFDGLYAFYNKNRTTEAYDLMGWRVTRDAIIDPGSATDGDIDVAFSLIVAYCQWGGDYLDEAIDILYIFEEYYYEECEGVWTMKPGGRFGGCGLTDLSYYCPGYYNIFEEVVDDGFWEEVAEDAYDLLDNGANPETGLVPDWMSASGVPGGEPSSGRTDYYRYDASRTPWRWSMDYLWTGNVDSKDWCVTVTNFANDIGPNGIVDGYDLDGTPRGQYNNSAFVGGFAVGSMCNTQEMVDRFSQRLLALERSRSDNNYFNLCLRNIYMLILTGNFWIPDVEETGIIKKPIQPDQLNLNQNYPNPFNPETTISYQLKEAGSVQLSIYDESGRRVKTLVNARQSSGFQQVQWDGTNAANQPVASGLYWVQLCVNDVSSEKKMVLIR